MPPETTAVIEAIADAKRRQPENLDYALQEFVEVDAIEMLAGHEESQWTLSFEIPDGTVTVTSGGEITVTTEGRAAVPGGPTQVDAEQTGE